VIDQFEELYTLVADPDERTAFLDQLVAAMDHAPIRVVLGLRADYYDRPLTHAVFGTAVSRATETVVPLNVAELELAVTGPAHHAGLALEEGLRARIISDVAGQPGGLPLLQHALSELYERRDGTTLTLAAYDEIGGVEGSLGRRAEATFSQLDTVQQAAARQILLRLVALTEGGRVTRRRALRTEVASLGGPRSVTATVLDAFGSHRLLSFDRDPGTRSPTVELAHEALTLAWPRLRDWIDAGRADLALQRRLAAAVAEWRDNDRDPAYLLTGTRLAQFEDWAQSGATRPTPLESEYLRAAADRRDAQAAAEQERVEREAALERRSRTRLRILLGVMAVAVAAVGALALIARRQTEEAERNLAISQAQRLTAQASDAVDVDPELGILLALEAAERSAAVGEPILPETVEALHAALPATRMVMTIPAGAIAFSPDGASLAGAEPGTSLSGGPSDGEVTIFDAATGAVVRSLAGHTARTFAVAYSPDGSLIATGGYDGTVRLWNAATGAEAVVLDAGPGLVAHIRFHASGSELLTISTGGGVKRWEPTGVLIAEYRQAGVAVDAAYLPDGRIAVAADDPGFGLFLWDAPDSDPEGPLAHPLGACGAVIDPTGTYLATSGSEGIVRVWDAATMTETQVLEGHGGRVCGLAFTPDGSRLVSVSEDGTARVWATDTGTELFSLVGHTAGVEHVAVSPDGRYVATGSGDGTTRIWDISPEGSREWLTVGDGSVATVSAAFDGDGSRLATGSQDGTATMWDAATGEVLATFAGHTSALWEIEFSPDGRLLLTASQDTTARVWDAATGAQLLVLVGHTDQVFGASFSPDGAFVFTSGFDGTVRGWDAATGAELGRVETGNRGVFGIDVSPDGEVLAASGDTVALLDSETGETIHEITEPIGVVTSVAFSPDGSTLVTGGADGTVRMWTLGNGPPQLAAELGGHSAVITAVAWDGTGDVLVTASPDGVVKVWNADGTERYTIRGVDAPAVIAVSPDGSRIAVPGSDGTVQVFVVDPHELLALAQARLTRGFSDDECRRYLDGFPCP
jgi:WD40 repeat protein